LRKDHRWGMADALSKSDKELLFKEHIESLNQRKKEQFRKLLDDTHEVHFILQCSILNNLRNDSVITTDFTD